MALAFDSEQDQTACTEGAAGVFTGSFTNTAGTIAIFGILGGKPVGNVPTTVTYGGISCSLIDSIAAASYNNDRDLYLYICQNSPTGANNLVVTNAPWAGETCFGNMTTYSGANLSGQPDAHQTTSSTSTSSPFANTLASITSDSCWMVMFAQMGSGGGNIGAGTTTTLRGSAATHVMLDSNGSVGVATSSWTLNATFTGSFGIGTLGVMIFPTGGAGGVGRDARKFALLGLG